MNSFNRNANSNPNQNGEGFPGDMHNFYFTHNPHANYNFYIATNSAPPPPNPTPTYAPPNVFQSGFPNNRLMGFQDRNSWMSMPSTMNTPSSVFQMSPLNPGGPGCFGHAHPHQHSHPHHHHHHHGHGHGCSGPGPASAGPSTSGRDAASTTSGVSSGCHSPDSSRFGDQCPLFAFVIQDQQGTFGFHPEQHPHHPGCICQFRQSPSQPQPQSQPAFGNPGGNHAAAHHCQCANGNRVGNPDQTNSHSAGAGGIGGVGGMQVRPGPVSLPRSTSSFSTASTSAFSSPPPSPGSAPSQRGSPHYIIEEPLSQNMSQN